MPGSQAADLGLQLQARRQHRTSHSGAYDRHAGQRLRQSVAFRSAKGVSRRAKDENIGFVMTTDEILFDTEERMEKAVNVFRDELRGLRTGRATPALVDTLRVEYYGSPTPLKQLAQINTPDPQQIVIRPFDQGCLKDIEKAIRSSDLGMSPTNDGKMIRLQVPPMSGEQRKKLVQRIKKSAEDAKVACRNIRRDGNKH